MELLPLPPPPPFDDDDDDEASGVGVVLRLLPMIVGEADGKVPLRVFWLLPLPVWWWWPAAPKAPTAAAAAVRRRR